MEPQPKQKASKHVCLTIRGPMGISDDPILDIVSALADRDVLTMVRGLAHEEIRSPFTDGVFGMDESRTNAAIRRMKGAGLISSRRDGPDHVYYLNKGRYKELEHFLGGLFAE
ncbi:MAG: ArsR/SmtB family transcription factor [Candidatus Methanomethylophilaceae archaeon]